MQCSGIRGVSAIVQNWKACCGGKDSIVHSKHAVILGIITRPDHNIIMMMMIMMIAKTVVIEMVMMMIKVLIVMMMIMMVMI